MPEIVKSLAGAEAGRESANRFLTEQRLLGWAIGVALSCAAITMLLWPALHAGHDGQHCLDFNWIWLTGKLAASHAAAQVYHPNAALPADVAALSQFHCAGTPGDGGFSYPPTILFFTYPLGFMSYSVALAVWNAATLVLYLAAVNAILPRAAAVAVALTTYPVVINLMIGHNGFLTPGLFGLALAFMERRPVLSGCFLGLLTYKPHLGVLFPLALPASRNWRVLIAAGVATIAFGVAASIALIAFGFDLWPSFLAGVIEARARVNHSHSVSNIIFPTALGVLRHFDVGIQTAWAVQAIVSALAASAVYILWSRPIPHALKAAAIAIASLLATPYALTYDYCILSMAAAFLVKDGLNRGFFVRRTGDHLPLLERAVAICVLRWNMSGGIDRIQRARRGSALFSACGGSDADLCGAARSDHSKGLLGRAKRRPTSRRYLVGREERLRGAF